MSTEKQLPTPPIVGTTSTLPADLKRDQATHPNGHSLVDHDAVGAGYRHHGLLDKSAIRGATPTGLGSVQVQVERVMNRVRGKADDLNRYE